MGYEFYGPGLGTNGGGESASNVMDFATPEDLVSAGLRPGAPEEEPETLFEQGWDWFRQIAGAKGQQAEGEPAAPMPGATPDGKPSADGFSQYAEEAAIRAVATVDEEQAPIEETPPDDPAEGVQRSWIEQYQTHITIASTLIGLGTFVIWLMVRKRD